MANTQRLELYRFRLAQAQCLKAMGNHVPAPPSLEEYLAKGATSDAVGPRLSREDRQRCEYLPARPPFLDW